MSHSRFPRLRPVVLLASWIVTFSTLLHAADLDRTILPIQLPKPDPVTTLDVREATVPARHEVKAPEGAPNVMIVLIDDLGFGATSPFGGPIPTPTLDRLAGEGLRYTHFHTTALCSPTRAALKSGRNHHTCNMGFITEMATGFPGATGEIPDTVAPLAEMLRLNGYSTAAFGKWHETAAWETSVSGPHDRWPTRQGFDKFYGFIGGETNQWAPYLFDGVAPVELPHDPDYHFMEDMSEKAIAWIEFQKAMTPDKPFFVYFAPGAVHAPHHAPKDWIAKWKGKFDQGWDKVREETLARQSKLGIVPPNTQLTARPEQIPAWDTLSADQKRLYARMMEVYAGALSYADNQIGRLLTAVKDSGQLDNTLVIFIMGDNGASAEGSLQGTTNEVATAANGVKESLPYLLSMMDKLGGPLAYNHYPVGWAHAMDAPMQWTKQVASH
ncbi:MAG TPA: sulfatase-like hydrolase/transferase, partial [Bacteroidia bacterium]|nr:sulfatase-like hydrolase/transferase [Bacteroidia bacterium]